MSSASSSNQNKAAAPLQAHQIFRAVLLTLGMATLFIVGQLIGIVLLVIGLNVAGFTSDDITDAFENNIAVQFLAVLLIELVTIGLLWLYHRGRTQDFLKQVGLRLRPTLAMLKAALAAYGLYFLTFLAIALIAPLIIPSLNVDQEQQLGFESPQGIEIALVYVSLVVLPAIAEEILFRGFFYQRLKAYVPVRTAVIVTSLLFAAAHLEFFGDNPLNWIAALDTFVLSLFLIRLLEKTGSLWASIFLHAIKNSVAFVILFILQQG